MKRRLFKTLVAVLAIAAAAAGPAWGQTTYNVTFGGFAESAMNTTVSVASLPQTFTEINNTYVFYAWKVISTTAENYTSASVTSGGNGKVSATIANSLLSITVSGTFEGTATIHVEGSYWDLNHDSPVPLSCDVTVACPEPPTPHTVRFAEGMSGWQVQDVTASASATAPAVLENVMAGDSLVVTAPASLPGKVKSVKAVKYVPPAATVTTDPTATAAYIEVGSTAALVNAGAANGGTMMYAVTTTNAQPASTADFSATIPTAENRAAGTYYVWFYAKADADHSDSEIAGPVSVTVAVMSTVTWSSSNISNLSVSGTYQSYTMEGITLSANTDMNQAEWNDYGDESMNGITFHVNQSGGFTFTAPTGKKFTKIEMTLTGQGGWDIASLGTGWAFGENFDPMTMDMICTVTWKGSAATTVGLLTGDDHFGGTQVKSIVFTLIDAQ